jgi:hypothetical protein
MLCGLQRPIKNYDPSSYENELYLISKRSKGYRGGFDNDYEPILGDDVYTPLIKNRILEIVKAFIEKGIISDYELDGIRPKKDESNPFLDEMVKKILYNALTGTSDKSDNYFMESKVKELTDQVDKLKTDYKNLEFEYDKLSQNYLEANIDYNDSTMLKDLLNYALIHLLKYCDAEIGGTDLNDFKVLLMKLDNDSTTLLGCLYQDLTVEEWCSLMEKIRGTRQIQAFLDYFTKLKKVEMKREYNKFQLLKNLMIFRFFKLLS